MLFQIDGTKTRLAGSMHVLPKGQPIPDWVESTYRWSNSLYLEHDEQALIPKLFLPEDQTSRQFFSPDTWASLTAAWPAHLGPPTRWKLWMSIELTLWWLVIFMGILTYYVWYAAPRSH